MIAGPAFMVGGGSRIAAWHSMSCTCSMCLHVDRASMRELVMLRARFDALDAYYAVDTGSEVHG